MIVILFMLCKYNLKALQKSEFQESLLRTVLSTDRDGDFSIDENEANLLVLKMKHVSRVAFDEDWLRKSLAQTSGDLASLIHLIRDYEVV